MRRSSKRAGRRTAAQRQPTDTGTIKSIELQRGTGSIAPDRDARVQSDTGFTSEVVIDGDVTMLHIGDRVQFNSKPSPNRTGYADATTVQADTSGMTRTAAEVAPPPKPEASHSRPPGAVDSTETRAVVNEEAALISSEEPPG